MIDGEKLTNDQIITDKHIARDIGTIDMKWRYI